MSSSFLFNSLPWLILLPWQFKQQRKQNQREKENLNFCFAIESERTQRIFVIVATSVAGFFLSSEIIMETKRGCATFTGKTDDGVSLCGPSQRSERNSIFFCVICRNFETTIENSFALFFFLVALRLIRKTISIEQSKNAYEIE